MDERCRCGYGPHDHSVSAHERIARTDELLAVLCYLKAAGLTDAVAGLQDLKHRPPCGDGYEGLRPCTLPLDHGQKCNYQERGEP